MPSHSCAARKEGEEGEREGGGEDLDLKHASFSRFSIVPLVFLCSFGSIMALQFSSPVHQGQPSEARQ